MVGRMQLDIERNVTLAGERKTNLWSAVLDERAMQRDLLHTDEERRLSLLYYSQEEAAMTAVLSVPR